MGAIDTLARRPTPRPFLPRAVPRARRHPAACWLAKRSGCIHGCGATADHQLTRADLVQAASLAMPESGPPDRHHPASAARLDLRSRDTDPVRDRGRSPPRYRRSLPPPHQEARRRSMMSASTPAAAYLAYCAAARLIDAHQGRRAGCCIGNTSLAESWSGVGSRRAVETRRPRGGLVRRATPRRCPFTPRVRGRGAADVRRPARAGARTSRWTTTSRIIGDLVYRRWRTVVEYEGAQHQEDRVQYVRDLGRYGWMRGTTSATCK